MGQEDHRDLRGMGGEGKSIEQIAEEYGRSIRNTRGKILKEFHDAYVAHLSEKEVPDLESICLVEQQVSKGPELVTRFWFEYRPVIE